MGDSKVSIMGSGDASLSPHGRVRLFIAGSGNLQLLTKPTELSQTIVGSGEARQLTGEAARNAANYSYKYDYDYKYDYAGRAASEAANNAVRSVLGNNSGPPIPPTPPTFMENAKTGEIFARGSNDTDLGHIEREALTVTVAHSGSLTAEGKVDRLTVNVLGSGNARLGKLAARTVTVSVMGSGSATVAPSESLKATIMGSGDVHLVTRPASIQRSIMGSGHIVEEH